MSIAAGRPKLIKAGFVQVGASGAIGKIIVFQYNPEALVRRLEGVGAVAVGAAAPLPGGTAAGGRSAGAGAAGGLGAGVSAGASASAGIGTAVGGGAAAGAGGGASAGAVGGAGASAGAGVAAPAARVEPRETVTFTLSLDAADNLERGDPATQQSGLLPTISALELLLYPDPATLTLWVSGTHRIMPVRISELVFNEQAFDHALNPIRTDVFVGLQVLKQADFPQNSHGRALWDAHFAALQQLARASAAGTLADLGLNGI